MVLTLEQPRNFTETFDEFDIVQESENGMVSEVDLDVELTSFEAANLRSAQLLLRKSELAGAESLDSLPYGFGSSLTDFHVSLGLKSRQELDQIEAICRSLGVDVYYRRCH